MRGKPAFQNDYFKIVKWGTGNTYRLKQRFSWDKLFKMDTLWNIVLAKWALIIEFYTVMDSSEYWLAGYAAENCAFCEMYITRSETGIPCLGCPIEILTGHPMCRETPYYDFQQKQDRKSAEDEYQWLVEAKATSEKSKI